MTLTLTSMDTSEILLHFLPPEIVTHFDIIEISESETDSGLTMTIHLDEKHIYPDGYSMETVESKGFIKATSVSDFPIRGKGVRLLIRRRKWVDKITGRSVSRSYGDLKHPGTNYTSEFGHFFKGTP
jgi:hypothetical protein